MFVKYDCGCIGTRPLPTQRAIIVVACDDDGNNPRESLSWCKRDMDGKSWEPVPTEQEEALHARIARRFAAADRFDNVRIALGINDGG